MHQGPGTKLTLQMLTGNVSQSDQSRIMRELEDGADDPSRDIRVSYLPCISLVLWLVTEADE